jgi:hypothetical protein
MSTRGQFNTKNPTIKRICKLASFPSPPPPQPNLQPSQLTSSSKRSLGAVHLALIRLPCRAPRDEPLRMALHHTRPPGTLGIRWWPLPWPYHPTSPISAPSSGFPLPHPDWPLRGEPRNLPKHIGAPRRDVAAGLGRAHCSGRHPEFHGHGCKGPAGWYRMLQGSTREDGKGEPCLEMLSLRKE